MAGNLPLTLTLLFMAFLPSTLVCFPHATLLPIYYSVLILTLLATYKSVPLSLCYPAPHILSSQYLFGALNNEDTNNRISSLFMAIRSTLAGSNFVICIFAYDIYVDIEQCPQKPGAEPECIFHSLMYLADYSKCVTNSWMEIA